MKEKLITIFFNTISWLLILAMFFSLYELGSVTRNRAAKHDLEIIQTFNQSAQTTLLELSQENVFLKAEIEKLKEKLEFYEPKQEQDIEGG